MYCLLAQASGASSHHFGYFVRSYANALVLTSMPYTVLQVAFSGEGTRGGTEGEQMVRDLQVRSSNSMLSNRVASFHRLPLYPLPNGTPGQSIHCCYL